MAVLKRGSRGEPVKALQRLYIKLGGQSFPVDGIFGDNMVLYTKKYQETFGLTQDGIFGPASLEVGRQVFPNDSDFRTLENYISGSSSYSVPASSLPIREEVETVSPATPADHTGSGSTGGGALGLITGAAALFFLFKG